MLGWDAMKTVVALGGEGIGVECVDAACEVLTAAGFPLKILSPPHGAAAVASHGEPVPHETRRLCEEADGVLFGAAGGPASSAVVGWLRWEHDAYANVRPIKHYPGTASPLRHPEGIDYVLLRENSEGLYPGREGDLAELARALPGLADRTGKRVGDFGDGRFAVKVVTPRGAERIARFACELARRRRARGRPGKVSCVTKANVLPRTDGLFREIAEAVVRAAGLDFEHFYVDDAARRLVRSPQAMDVVLCMNLYGDILSDLGAEAAGGLGLAPSGCYGDGWAYFESVHGSAPDIAGRGIANPTAVLLSAAMMLEHMGLAGEAERLEAAVAGVYREGGPLTPDQGGRASTRQFCAAVLARLRGG
jgi:isocitrate/isopropylmalate dehydrogenase